MACGDCGERETLTINCNNLAQCRVFIDLVAQVTALRNGGGGGGGPISLSIAQVGDNFNLTINGNAVTIPVHSVKPMWFDVEMQNAFGIKQLYGASNNT